MKSRFKLLPPSPAITATPVGIMVTLALFLFGIVPIVNVVQGQTACNMLTGNNYVFPQVDFPTTSFIYECQNTTLYMGQANISFFGYLSSGALVSLDQWANGAATTITVTPNTGLIWETPINTCTTLNAALPTNATCQYVLQVRNFGTTGVNLNYEALQGFGFQIGVRIRLASGRANCPWQILNNVTVAVKDCNEYPAFDTSIPTSLTIKEYNGIGTSYAGSIVNLLVNDPDVFNTVYGNLTLSIVSIIRPLKGNEGVDPTPFYIQGYNFLYTNNNDSALRYDVSRCPVVSTCLDIFDAYYDNAGAAPYTSRLRFRIQVIDGGGLAQYLTVDVTVKPVPRAPEFLTLPGSVTISEDIVGAPTTIYPVQYIVPYIGTGTSSIEIIGINPPVDFSGGSYIVDVDGGCTPAPTAPVICSAVKLTTLVDGTTFNYLLQDTYNLTIWAIHDPADPTENSVTVSSSLIIYIGPANKQPDLIPSFDVKQLTEDTQQQSCIYNMSNIPDDPNGDTTFYYTFLNATDNTALAGSGDMWYLNGTQICYNGLFSSVGTCCSRVFANYLSPYTIYVQIKDAYTNPTPYPTFTLSVNIIKVDDPPILYVPSTVTVLENATSFSFDVNATQYYPASGTSNLLFTVSATTSMAKNAFFQVSTQTSTKNNGDATVSVFGPGPEFFNFTLYPIIKVNVTVSDGILEVTKTTIVYVQYVNRPPEIDNLPDTVTMKETVQGFKAFFTVSATDKENDPLIYQFIDSGAYTQTISYFSIDYNLGIIYYDYPNFNWFTQNFYRLPVMVRDAPAVGNGKNASNGPLNLTVVLELVNRAPRFTYPLPMNGDPNATVSFYENVTGQDYIFTFEGYDRENDSLYYNITAVNPVDNSAFVLGWGTNLLEYNSFYASSSPMFNASIQPLYHIVVEITDADHLGNSTSTTTITVSILPVPKPAYFTSLPITLEVREDVVYGTPIWTVGAVDPTGNGTLVITYLGTFPATLGNVQFYYDNVSQAYGYIDNPGFNYDQQTSYTAIWTAWNGIGKTVTSSLNVHILEVNTGPYATTYNYTVTYAEDTTLGRLIWDLRAASNHSLGIKYAIVDASPASGNFYVTTDGLVKLIDYPTFDYVRAPKYTVTIVAYDTGLQDGQQNKRVSFTLTVSITEVSQYPVITNLPNFVSVKEGAPGAAGLYIVKCNDPRGKTLSWDLQVLPNSQSSQFQIFQNGSVFTTSTSNFTYIDQPQYWLVVYCGNSDKTVSRTLSVTIVWTTTTQAQTTTTAPAVTTVAETTTETSSSGLTTEQIAAIAGSLGGALLLAGVAYGIAKLMENRARKQGTTQRMKQPVAAVNELWLR